ncbi:hypothetical protein Tco_0645945 [Tanacetum coccineum]
MSLSAEVRMRAEYNIKEKRKFKSIIDEKNELLKVKNEEILNLKAQMLLKEAKPAEAIRLRGEASTFEANALDVKATNLEASAMDKDRELVNLNAQLTSVKSQNDSLTHQVYELELAISKYLNSTEYLSALGAAIGKAVKKGMHDGLSAGITQGTEGRALTDAGLDRVTTTRRPTDGPHSHSPDHVFVGASALSLALDVSSSRVRKIKENIANYRSVLHDVFVPLAEPMSSMAVMGTKGTSDVMPATADITTDLSTTFASASTVTPISVYDYEVIGTDDQIAANENVVDGNVNPFPNVDDVELNAH